MKAGFRCHSILLSFRDAPTRGSLHFLSSCSPHKKRLCGACAPHGPEYTKLTRRTMLRDRKWLILDT